eukprot:3460548-Alexandrium_andersonii.AAC.1
MSSGVKIARTVRLRRCQRSAYVWCCGWVSDANLLLPSIPPALKPAAARKARSDKAAADAAKT